MADNEAKYPEVGYSEGETKQVYSSGLVSTSIAMLSKKWKLQRQYLFEFLLPDVSGISGIEVAQYCQEVKFGEYSMSDISTLRYGAFRKGYAGMFDIGTVSATFLKPIPDLVGMYFFEWRRLIIDEDGFYYPKNHYAKQAYIRLYDRTGAITNSFRLTGLFPKTFPSYDLSYKSEGVVEIEIEFNVDRVYYG